MTSTISLNKSKKPLLSMILLSIKNTLPITLIYSFLLFVCFPMYITLSRKSAVLYKFDYVSCQEQLMEIVPTLLAIFTIVTACFMFNIYHKKRSVDLYASLPVKKHTLFLSKYFAGLIVIILPLVVFMSLGLFASFEVNSLNSIVTYSRMLAYIVSVINIYSMLAFFAMICGGVLDTLVSFGVVNIGVASCLFIGISLIGSIVPGYYNIDVTTIDRFTYMLFFSLCPCVMPYMAGTFADVYRDSISGELVYNLGEDSLAVETKTLIIWFVLALVYLAAAIIIAKKRRNENVQNGFIFGFPKIIIQVLASGAASLILSYFVVGELSSENTGFETFLFFMLSTLVGSLLGYLIVSLVYNKGPKRFIKSIPTFIVSFVAVAMFYLSISLGLVGVSSVPKVDDIKSVAVFDEDSFDYYYYDDMPVVFSRGNSFEKANFFIEDKEVIKNTVALHQSIVDGLHDEAGTFFNFGSYNYYYGVPDSDTGYEPGSIRIEYILNNGKKITKSYSRVHFKYDDIKDEFNSIISSDVFKNHYFKIANCADAEEANVSAMNIYASKRYTNINSSSTYSQDAFFGNIIGVTAGDSDWIENDKYDSEMVNKLFSTLHEEFLADKNYADTLKAKQCEYVKQTRDNFEVYDEIVYNIWISYSTKLSYEAAEKMIDSLDGIKQGMHFQDPDNFITITQESYPKTFELLNNYFENENVDQLHLYPNY
ncbi:MAG: hypothetical protein UHY68_04530 [Acutalibacteraceae bacterium]|nr:hypothetical protein [Acutalibacteraceae bacterium]